MRPQDLKRLPDPAVYFPIEKGLYEVAPGLRPLGTEFGNGVSDRKVVQVDRAFAKYRANRLKCRSERLTKYVIELDTSLERTRSVNRFLVQRLLKDEPEWFSWFVSPDGGGKLKCHLTGDVMKFDPSFDWRGSNRTLDWEGPDYLSGFDALVSQMQEDLGILCLEPDFDRLQALHLCSPSHWAAEDKIGRSFFDIHAPIPGVDRMNRSARALSEAMVHKGPYVRFVWGFATDDRLNHHPEPAPGEEGGVWKGRSFDASMEPEPFLLRVERQVTFGIPAVGISLFFIRVSFVPGSRIRSNPQWSSGLVSALRSMTPESRRYKGLEESFDPLLDWLTQA